MSMIVCRRCGATTNTAVCDHVTSADDKADKCYAKWEDERWVKGCAYVEACIYTKPFVDGLINDPRFEVLVRQIWVALAQVLKTRKATLP